MQIPFNRPFIAGKEIHYIAQAVQGGQLAGDGPFSRRCEAWMEEHFEARKVLLTPSGTAALEMCAMLTNVGPGDEVIMPSYTFPSTANAFVLRGATPRFVDIREDTLNLDERLVEAAIGERTKAIVPVHYAGNACEMDRVLGVAAQHGLMVIEDAAQGVNATYQGRYLGTMGALGAYSFHETKNFIAGEGGALVINDESLVERAEILRHKGTNRAHFDRGEVDRYTWVDVGSSFLPSELVAAFLFAQLEEAERITAQRRSLYDRYMERLAPLEEKGDLRLPRTTPGAEHNAHLVYATVPQREVRDRLLSFLQDQGILAIFHYVPLHTSPMGQRLGCREGELPVTEAMAGRVLRLPCYFELDEETQDVVIDAVFRFFGQRG